MLDSVFRQYWGRVVASLVGYLGDFELAEDAAQEAFAIAAERWPRQGTPENPVAWLITTARNRAIDRIRRERALAAKTRLLERDEAVEDDVNDLGSDQIGDERLELLFTCCHPALSIEAQVALTLRTLGGLANDEIARAFLVSPETMKRRLSRARTKIKLAGIPFSVPAGAPPPGAPRRRPGRHLSHLQRGLRRPRRPCHGGDRPGHGARQSSCPTRPRSTACWR